MKATASKPKTSAETKAGAAAKPQSASRSKNDNTNKKNGKAEDAAAGKSASSSKSGGKGGGVKLDGAERKELVRFYRQMVLVRDFELRAGQAYTQAKIGGYCHLNLGEEATVVGLTAAMKQNDYLYGGYRFHGYALCRGLDTGSVMAELFGKSTGVSKGRGGSMHLFDAGKRVMGGYGIVGGQIPLATGAAYAIDYRTEPGPDAEAVMCLLGDGTTAIGAFHESLNIASLWNLPIVYVIVNNQLGMGTTVENSSAEPELYKRAAGYRMRGERVDGNDVLAVRDAAADAMREAREERRPVLLETISYRMKGHSVVDPARYRTKEELEYVKSMDPLPPLRERLISEGILSEDEAIDIETQVEDEVNKAVEFADESPSPEPSALFDGVYATQVANMPNHLPGDPVLAGSANADATQVEGR